MDLKGVINPRQRRRDKKPENPKMEAPTLDANMFKEPPMVVFGPTNGINMPDKSTKDTTESVMDETSEPSRQMRFPIMTYSVPVGPVRASQSQERGKASATQGELFSGKSAESYEIKDQATYYLRMLRDCYRTKTDGLSPQSSFHWMTLGMMSSGRCSTQKISVFPKIGSECSLSDILEKKVDSKYFLSPKAVRAILPIQQE